MLIASCEGENVFYLWAHNSLEIITVPRKGVEGIHKRVLLLCQESSHIQRK